MPTENQKNTIKYISKTKREPSHTTFSSPLRRGEAGVDRDHLHLPDDLLPRRGPPPWSRGELDDGVAEHEGPDAVAEAVGVELALEGRLACDFGGEGREERGVELGGGGRGES